MKEETRLFLEFDYPLGNEFLEITPFLIGVGNTNGIGQKSLQKYLKSNTTIPNARLFTLQMGPFGLPFLAASQLVPTKRAFTNFTGKFYWDGQEEEAMIEHKRKIEFERTILIEKWKNALPHIKDDDQRYKMQYSIDYHEHLLKLELEETIPVKHPVYSTIYMHFERKLEREEIEFIQRRAYEYIETEEWPCSLVQIRVQRICTEEEALVPALGFVKEAILPTARTYFGLEEEIISEEKPDNLMNLNFFIQSMELGIIKDSNYKIKAICTDKGVVSLEELNPSDILFNKKYLLDYQSKHGELSISVLTE